MNIGWRDLPDFSKLLTLVKLMFVFFFFFSFFLSFFNGKKKGGRKKKNEEKKKGRIQRKIKTKQNTGKTLLSLQLH